jgi:hypothetical protein
MWLFHVKLLNNEISQLDGGKLTVLPTTAQKYQCIFILRPDRCSYWADVYRNYVIWKSLSTGLTPDLTYVR